MRVDVCGLNIMFLYTSWECTWGSWCG